MAQMPVAAYSPYVMSSDGQEVTDTSTGLVWRRCAEGARWDGNNCMGIADTYNYNDALGRVGKTIGYGDGAFANTAEGRHSAPANSTAWRLPTVYELSTITDRNRSNPTIDGAAFPNTPASWYWTSTFDTTNPSYIWIISFYNGYASNIGAYNKGYVRLVRGNVLTQSKAQ
jgi:Protein of unknown function (DUF1566)